MSRADNYRQYATACAGLAQLVRVPEDRVRLMEMAALWLRLAERAEAAEKQTPPDADD
jgi:hypothetical protein